MAEPNFATLDEAATTTHEIFMSYVRAGFERSEALELVKQMVPRWVPPEEKREDK